MTIGSVLISGAGIAGSTAAYWLADAGWHVTLVEKASNARSSGNPIDVRGDAAVVAHAMGIWPRLEAAATGVNRLVFVDAAGRRRAIINSRQHVSSRDEVEVARTDLAGALLDAARVNSELISHDSIAALQDTPAGVEIEFEHAPPRRFDLVIGADGLHSNVRRLAFGAEHEFSHPFGMFVGTMHTDVEPPDPREVMMFNAPGRSLSIHPGGGRPMAAFIFRSREEYDYRNADAGKRLVGSAFSGVGWLAEQLIAEWNTTDDVYFDSVTRIEMPHWSHGNTTLIGDAANCISLLGEGSSNAIIGAKTLVDALGRHPDDHGAALAAYEAAHRKHLAPYLRGARLGARFLVPKTQGGIAVRNAALRLVSHKGQQRSS